MHTMPPLRLRDVGHTKYSPSSVDCMRLQLVDVLVKMTTTGELVMSEDALEAVITTLPNEVRWACQCHIASAF